MRRGPEEETHRGAPLSSNASAGPLRDEPLVAIVTTSAGGIILPVPERSPFIVGRASDCELAIPDLSVSRRHLRVSVGDDLRVEDLSSANGTSYDGRRLRPYEETVIGLGQALTIGSVTVFVHAAQAVVAPGRAAGPGVLFTPPVVEIVRDEASKRIYATIPTIAPSPLSVLVLGETGVGKEVFADAIHRASRRAHKPLLKLNCAALPESILEGELFGYERGAFSGAVVARPGLFESAHEGTIFLDEVGELPLHTQAKLLRVLESGEVMRLGARSASKIDVRFIAATNVDLRAAMERGEFRRDLFYRLEGIRVEIPPLRARPEDVVALAEFFLARLAGRMGLVAPQLTESARDVLKDYAWPGNVRELRNTIERALVMNPEAEFLTESDLVLHAPESIRPPPPSLPIHNTIELARVEAPPVTRAPALTLRSSLDEIEEKAIREALAKTNGNQSAAARLLGIGRHALIKRIEAYGIGRPRTRT
ncbi:MAG: Response regulator of zinc sigma-54-dependent two-component system [Labilithrix sp.]|nr:Response regulator of zinc sigma-54-dependent two-component system [Labilithrix sp.]